jgi:hypothetical protein
MKNERNTLAVVHFVSPQHKDVPEHLPLAIGIGLPAITLADIN